MRRGRTYLFAGLIALALTAGAAGAASRIELISQSSSSEGAPSGLSTLGQISADGRYVAFVSRAGDVISGQVDQPARPGDPLTPGSWDVFLRDRATGKTTLVSHASSSAVTGGTIGNYTDDSIGPVLSPDGRYVAYLSRRANLVPGQSGSAGDINLFLYDRVTNTTKLVSHRRDSSTAGTFGEIFDPPSLSADGRFVAYVSDSEYVVPGHDTQELKILLYDRTTGVNAFVGVGGGQPKISADGQFVVFYDKDSQLRLFDRVAGTTTLVSHAAGSPEAPANDESGNPEISADGGVVAFDSWATDLVPGQTDSKGTEDLFLYDRASGQTTLVSRTATSPTTAVGGSPSEPSLSADGRWLGFYSTASNMISGVTDGNNDYDVFLYDRTSGAMTLVSHTKSSGTTATASGGSFPAVVSADGSKVAFLSPAKDLADLPPPPGSDGWWSLFLYDRSTGANTFVGWTTRGGLPGDNQLVLGPRISADGAVAFTSWLPLVTEDANGNWDVYLYGPELSPGDGGGGEFVPCTVLDTRTPAGGPALRSNVRRVLDVAGTCGIPTTARSVAINVTVLQAANKGKLQIYPGNARKPAAMLRFQKNVTLTESFTVPLATNGAGTLALLPIMKGGTVQAVIEVTGYSE
jgi:Tol biopolymer transport system component